MSSITVLERKKNDIDLAVMSYSYAYSSCVENERLKRRNIGSSATQHVQPSLKSFKQQWVMYKLENCFLCFCEGKKYANQLTFDRVDIVINAKINYNMDNNKGVEGIENCGEEQTKQIRSRTALTREGPSSRLLGSSLMMRLW